MGKCNGYLGLLWIFSDNVSIEGSDELDRAAQEMTENLIL